MYTRTPTAVTVRHDLRALANPEKARILQRFFKTGPGEYGEGDIFLGIMVPHSRQVARTHRELPLDEVRKLLRSKVHEERLVALFILVLQFARGGDEDQKRIFDLYLANTRWINNWDLVDCSADRIVGAYLADRPRNLLRELARSSLLWERRIAILATFHFIRRGEFSTTLEIAELLLRDPHDLIHKAVGWMLREIGKRDSAAEERFLDAHAPDMPRTMLRYAIERFPEKKRRHYLRPSARRTPRRTKSVVTP